jgi:hypothetical protein
MNFENSLFIVICTFIYALCYACVFPSIRKYVFGGVAGAVFVSVLTSLAGGNNNFGNTWLVLVILEIITWIFSIIGIVGFEIIFAIAIGIRALKKLPTSFAGVCRLLFAISPPFVFVLIAHYLPQSKFPPSVYF